MERSFACGCRDNWALEVCFKELHIFYDALRSLKPCAGRQHRQREMQFKIRLRAEEDFNQRIRLGCVTSVLVIKQTGGAETLKETTEHC